MTTSSRMRSVSASVGAHELVDGLRKRLRTKYLAGVKSAVDPYDSPYLRRRVSARSAERFHRRWRVRGRFHDSGPDSCGSRAKSRSPLSCGRFSAVSPILTSLSRSDSLFEFGEIRGVLLVVWRDSSRHRGQTRSGPSGVVTFGATGSRSEPAQACRAARYQLRARATRTDDGAGWPRLRGHDRPILTRGTGSCRENHGGSSPGPTVGLNHWHEHAGRATMHVSPFIGPG